MRSHRLACTSAAALCIIAGVACGGGSEQGSREQSPTGPSPQQVPAASITLDGTGQLKACVRGDTNIRCDFENTGKNAGPGCATRVRGTVRFQNEAKEEVAMQNWTLESSRVLKPDESFAYTFRLNLPAETFAGIAGYTQQAMWTNATC